MASSSTAEQSSSEAREQRRYSLGSSDSSDSFSKSRYLIVLSAYKDEKQINVYADDNTRSTRSLDDVRDNKSCLQMENNKLAAQRYIHEFQQGILACLKLVRGAHDCFS